MFEVRTTCQSFYCQAMHADRAEFEAALTWLVRSIPAAESIQEAAALTDRLKICTAEVGVGFHQQYHRRTSQVACAGSAVENAMHVWRQHHTDPRVTLQRWIEEFLLSFDATHPTPPAEKAASILRARFTDPPGLTALASAVGASRSRLVRDFRQRYRMSVGEYATRVRLHAFIEALRKPASSATRAAEGAGYGSYHNAVDALRRRTGFAPAAVRALKRDAVRELLDVTLTLEQTRLS
jgi:AraC-like DNA-binding protein